MAKQDRSGTCLLCKQKFSNSGISKHLSSHKEVLGGIRLAISDAYQPEFWLQIAVNPKAELTDLDVFLRDIWLECCGHLSSFQINGFRYESYYDENETDYADSDMDILLEDVLKEGLTFSHEYDFGSTTHLKLKVVTIGKEWQSKEPIVLLARNVMPTFICVTCGANATELCVGCQWRGSENAFCKTCYNKHDCAEGEDLWLPIVNSPRMGVCGYVG